MNGVDYGIIAVAAIGAIGGLIKGAIRNLITVGGICLGLFLGMRYSDELTSLLKNLMPQNYAHPVAFGIILLAAILLFRAIGTYLEWILKGLGLGGVNRLIGAAAGGLMAALIGLGLITAVDHFTHHRLQGAIEESKIARHLSPLVRKITGLVELERIEKELKERVK
jgi:uncharacterized membrane protein required for colicin V production